MTEKEHVFAFIADEVYWIKPDTPFPFVHGVQDPALV